MDKKISAMGITDDHLFAIFIILIVLDQNHTGLSGSVTDFKTCKFGKDKDNLV